jgi:hypothetical protein
VSHAEVTDVVRHLRAILLHTPASLPRHDEARVALKHLVAFWERFEGELLLVANPTPSVTAHWTAAWAEVYRSACVAARTPTHAPDVDSSSPL